MEKQAEYPLLRAWLQAILAGLGGLVLFGCQYSWQQAMQDSKSEEIAAREKALNYFVEYLTRVSGDSKEPEDQKRKAVQAVGETGLPKAINALRMVLMHDPASSLRIEAIRSLGQLRAPQAMEEIRGAVKDREMEVRMTAVAALGRLGDPSAMQDLLKSLQDPQPEVRAVAVRSLTELGADRGIPRLIPALDDPDANVRKEAETALVSFGQKAVQPLLEEVGKPASPLRQRVIDFFPRMGSVAMIPLIRAAFTPATEEGAMRALAAISHDGASWPIMKQLLASQKEKEGESFLEQLNTTGTMAVLYAFLTLWPQIPVAVRSKAPATMGRIAARLGETGRSILAKASEEGDDLSIRAGAILALGFTGPIAMPKLKPHLAAPQRPLVIAAIRALGEIRYPALPLLLPYLLAADEEIRINAIQVIGPIKTAQAADALMDQLRHPSAKIRVAALEALARQEDKRAIPRIREMLKDPINNVVIASIQSLLALGDQQNVNVYVTALRQGPYPPEPSYVRTLGQLGDSKLIPLLRQLTRRYMQDWKRYVERASRELDRQAANLPPEEHEKIAEKVKDSLVEDPARQTAAMCSFVEAYRGLLRFGDQSHMWLRKEGYLHAHRFNPLRSLPDSCPWPTIAPIPIIVPR